jgi:hypothetical protein
MINIGIGIPFGQRSAGIDPQAKIAFDSLQSAGFTTPQGITGINAAFKTIKTIYGTSDITTAISFFGDPSLAYQIGAGSGTTLGQAIRTLPNIIDPTRATDAVQTTAASQPLLLTHTTGNNYWWGSGVTGNFAQTSSTTFPTNSGYRAVARVKIEGVAARTFICKDSGSGAGRCFTLTYNGSTFNSQFGNSFANNAVCTVPIAVGFDKWVKVTADSVGSDMVVKFFESNDNIIYSQLGLDVVVAGQANSIQVNNSPYIISGTSGGANPFFGKIYRAQAFDVNDNLLVDFNPNQYNPSTSQTQWTSSTGEVWSIQTGTATSGYKGALVTKTIIQGDGVDDRMITSSNIITADGFTMYTAFRGLKDDLGTGANTFGMNNDDGSISRTNATSIRFWFGASGARNLVISGIDATRLGLAITRRKSGDFAVSFNNGTNNTSTEAVVYTPNLLTIFNYNTTVFTNSIFNTGIITKITDDSTQRTAMYNYIRSINNNAF